jgi:hypothetical protein
VVIANIEAQRHEAFDTTPNASSTSGETGVLPPSRRPLTTKLCRLSGDGDGRHKLETGESAAQQSGARSSSRFSR